MQKVEQKNEAVALSAKQTLKNITEVRPKNTADPTASRANEKKDLISAAEDRQKKTSTQEDTSSSPNNKASVKKAAEKYETHTANQEHSSANSNLHLRIRSKSIGNSRKELFEDGVEAGANKETKTNLPWAGMAAKTPLLKKKPLGGKDKNYALQMSKSSDSITAAKLLAKARSESKAAGSGGLRINQNFSKSIEQQIDVYSKTKEEIRMILSLAKSGSVNDRIALFSNMVNTSAPTIDPDEKAENIRREIEEARANAQETVSDTEIEFQEPIESKVKPLKIPMKPKLLGNADNDNTLRINQSRHDITKERRPSIEELPSLKSKLNSYKAATEEMSKPLTSDQKIKPILVKKNEKERSRSPRKKTPKLVSDHYLSPNQAPFQIYAQSATDMSATEDEFEAEKNRKISVPTKFSTQDPGPGFLKVPQRAVAEAAKIGLMKSKSFASPGQFECSIDNDSITSKKMTMMSFFANEPKPKSIMKKQPLQRRASLTSITDEVIGDEDLDDIDQEFENLLTQTFERESNKQKTRSSSHAGLTVLNSSHPTASGKLGGGGGGGERSTGGRFAAKQSSVLQKSKSFSASSHPRESLFYDSDEDLVQLEKSASYKSDNMNQKIREGFDPVAALPTSSRGGGAVGGQQARSPPPMYNSPSPTPSEYDTADPDTYD